MDDLQKVTSQLKVILNLDFEGVLRDELVGVLEELDPAFTSLVVSLLPSSSREHGALEAKLPVS